MNSAEKVARLKAMARKAGKAIYDRTKMASEVLADKAWLDSEHLGDYDKALACLQEECFPELSKAFSLGRLLALYATFPDHAFWARCRYNLMALWAEYEDRQAEGRPEPVERRHATLAQLEERDEKIKELEWQLKTSVESAKTAIADMERLRTENAELRGQLKQLQAECERLHARLDRRRIDAA